MKSVATDTPERAQRIRVEGLVQGVGFRPMVWHLARRLGLRGTVRNDGHGVAIHVCGSDDALAQFTQGLRQEAPPLAHVERVTCSDAPVLPPDVGFTIAGSASGAAHTGVAPDAATCAACLAETLDAASRRYRYPFTNCTHCGPRLTITAQVPYDRVHTTMQPFTMCAACRAEYDDPLDRRFHAQPIACPACGPRLWLETRDGAAADPSARVDAIDAACALLRGGAIVAIKGLGGFQLACDATNAEAVARLRTRKHRATKPFAIMARDMAMVRTVASVDACEEAALRSPAAPIVLLERRPGAPIADAVAPGLRSLGTMLPGTPLHHLLLRGMDGPIVLTSGNHADAPQLIDNDAARTALSPIADAFLLHDRAITRRVDDSVLHCAAGATRVLRRARGLAPAPIALHPDFAACAPVLAVGGDLKNAFCLLQDGQATLSHHVGELRDARTLADHRHALADYRQLFDHRPQQIALDLHPQSLAGAQARAGADDAPGIALVPVQHHHAHIAACLAENGIAPDAPDVIGVALDGMGHGDDGMPWGGEFLRASYRGFIRLARFKPVALPGGDAAMREPWRNTYAHLVAAIGWPAFTQRHGNLALHRQLQAKPLSAIDRMLAAQINSPLSSSCARLFDAVAAACGICFDPIGHEGQAAMALEACVDRALLGPRHDAAAYPFAITPGDATTLPCIDPAPMWQALLDDLQQAVPVAAVAARFHCGLAIAIVQMVQHTSVMQGTGAALQTVALSGGVMQNRILLEQLCRRLDYAGFTVLTHHRVPANDGGIALGQAAVAAARLLAGSNAAAPVPTPAFTTDPSSPCA